MFGVDISVWSVTWSAVALCCVVLTQIYYASEEFGVHDIQTSGGYFHMAEVFQQQGNVTVAQSLYRQVMCCHSSFSVLSPSDAALLVAVRSARLNLRLKSQQIAAALARNLSTETECNPTWHGIT